MTANTLSNSEIKARREAILLEMQSIREMIRGKITLQTFQHTLSDGSVVQRGPYALFQRWREGKNHCERIPKDDLPAVSRAVDGYQRFTQLADEYAALTEILTERGGPLLPSKKNSRHRLPRKNTGKPNPSSSAPSTASRPVKQDKRATSGGSKKDCAKRS
jgi:hypothetical protein